MIRRTAQEQAAGPADEYDRCLTEFRDYLGLPHPQYLGAAPSAYHPVCPLSRCRMHAISAPPTGDQPLAACAVSYVQPCDGHETATAESSGIGEELISWSRIWNVDLPPGRIHHRRSAKEQSAGTSAAEQRIWELEQKPGVAPRQRYPCRNGLVLMGTQPHIRLHGSGL
jgi:hypothetical protein